jgi:predicted PurR-regulated permease PerM
MFGRDKKELEITISNKTILRIIGFIIGAGLIINFFSSIRHPLTLIFVSVFLALALNPAVTYVAKKLKNRSRTRATAIAYVAVITVLIAFFSLILPPLVNQTADFINDVPETLRELENDQGAVGNFVRRYNLQEQVIQVANDWAKDTNAVADQAVTTVNRVISNLVSIITVLILTFMMLVEGNKWITLFWSQFPANKRDKGKKLATKMYGVVTGFVNGQVLVAAIGATFAVIALTIATAIFDVSTLNPIAFGGIVFLFGLIPTIGVIISTTIVVLFSLFASVPLALTMLVFFIVYQQVENATIQPYIQSRVNELTPLIVFVSVIIGVGFGGVLGAIIAIPIAGCIKVLLEDYVLKKETTEIHSKSK